MMKYYITDNKYMLIRQEVDPCWVPERYDYRAHDWVEDRNKNMCGEFFLELNEITEQEAEEWVAWNEKRIAETKPYG